MCWHVLVSVHVMAHSKKESEQICVIAAPESPAHTSNFPGKEPQVLVAIKPCHAARHIDRPHHHLSHPCTQL